MNTHQPIYNTSTLQYLFNHLPKENVDFLADEVAQRMLDRMRDIQHVPSQILDVGGSAQMILHLMNFFPQAQILGVDIAEQRLFHAQKQIAQSVKSQVLGLKSLFSKKKYHLLAADLTHLPFSADSFDLIWSNQILHWYLYPEQIFSEWFRVMKQDALLMFSSLGPATLQEMKAVRDRLNAQALGNQHAIEKNVVLNLLDMHDFGDCLLHAGFRDSVMDQETLTLTYETPNVLLQDLRTSGLFSVYFSDVMAQNFLETVQQILDEKGVFSLTFEVIYGHTWKMASKRQNESVIFFQESQKHKK